MCFLINVFLLFFSTLSQVNYDVYVFCGLYKGLRPMSALDDETCLERHKSILEVQQDHHQPILGTNGNNAS